MSDHYKHWSGRMVYTEGMKRLAEQGACYWWLDLIASYQGVPRVRAEEFQVWRLRVAPDKSAVATMTNGGTGDDDADKPIVTQKIEFTDYAKDEIETWVVLTPGCPPVAMQPCEY